MWWSTYSFNLGSLQALKDKQKEWENKARLQQRLAGKGLAKEPFNSHKQHLFTMSVAPLQKKSTAAKPEKQQAVVQPLQGQLYCDIL